MVPRFATLGRIPKGVWVLGGVSLLMDVSSEMIHSLLPLFMATTLGASVIIIGLIEGLAEATALILKVFSGAISDYVGKRKGLALLGYGLGALSKPLFAIAPTAGVVFSARMIDRVGKGIRGAPRDALVADVTPPEIRGAAYGLRQALDTVGAFLGPLLAVLLMFIWANDFHAIFWVAVIPAILVCVAVGVIVEKAAYKPVREKGNSMTALITAIAMSLLLENGSQAIFGADFQTVPTIFHLPSIAFGKLKLPGDTLLTIVIGLVIMVGLQLFVKFTKQGKAMRAVSEDKEASILMGINVNSTITLTFAIGSQPVPEMTAASSASGYV